MFFDVRLERLGQGLARGSRFGAGDLELQTDHPPARLDLAEPHPQVRIAIDVFDRRVNDPGFEVLEHPVFPVQAQDVAQIVGVKFALGVIAAAQPGQGQLVEAHAPLGTHRYHILRADLGEFLSKLRDVGQDRVGKLSLRPPISARALTLTENTCSAFNVLPALGME